MGYAIASDTVYTNEKIERRNKGQRLQPFERTAFINIERCSDSDPQYEALNHPSSASLPNKIDDSINAYQGEKGYDTAGYRGEDWATIPVSKS